MIVQIYAATSVDQAVAMARLGVDHVGFVAGDYNEVYAELSFTEARAIADALKNRARSSALTMSTDISEILRMAEAVQPDIIHISSDTEAVDVAAITHLRRKLPSQVVIMKAIPVDGPETIVLARKFAPVADILLLDTKVQGLPGVGATGVIHDWDVSRRIVETIGVRARIILAGGLTPENVKGAILATGAWGVDSNTGTNIPGDPVAKDMERVKEFVKQAKPA